MTIFLLSLCFSPTESIAQEMELERKNRQASENDVKGPLQERSNYYKNSMLYTSAT